MVKALVFHKRSVDSLLTADASMRLIGSGELRESEGDNLKGPVSIREGWEAVGMNPGGQLHRWVSLS